ncbi:MAG: radical SAM protein [Candidatus Auribacter fodinae]|jgi:radical SAM superfamily enzyme YgiQ (UPF0313 family)|uniref:Radical SAM protein n=1 Tax=Candidatus Auribacter fodinae TaxID=2093366 RepID=A0A3A4R2K2_9BACT|nr:MAG: radical SAM protein [Candidatus Auribacter fodinae]
MNVFLVYIRDEDFYSVLSGKSRGSKHDDGRIKVTAMPPLGIQTLAPVLRQHGHRVRLFDTCHPQMKSSHVAEAIKEEKPDVIGISILSTTTYLTAKKFVQDIRAAASHSAIILGGPFVTMNAKNILQDCPEADCLAIGEGEELLPDYLNNLNNPGAVAGLIWRKGTEIIINPPRPLIQNLDKYPYPDRTSLPIDYIESLPLDIPAVLSMDKFCTIQTSRGCPFSCVYCGIPIVNNGKWRFRSAEHVLGEMQELNDMGYRSIYLTDDHFLINSNRIQDICNGIIERKLQFKWGCEGRVDSVGVRHFKLMQQANCNFLAFGIEAGTQKVLNRLHKHQTLQQIKDAVSKAKRSGIERAHGFFVIGSPDETKEDILKSFTFAAKLKLDTFGFNRLCVYRGTPLWQEYVDRGIINDETDWYKWFKCSDIDPTVVPSEEINKIRMKGYALLFAYRIFFRTINTLKLLCTLGKHMKISDMMKLLFSPFIKRQLSCKAELPCASQN